MTYPFWLEWLIPLTWMVIFPVNFLKNLLVLVLTMKYLKVMNRKQNVKAVILRTWVMEGAANLIGTATLFIITQIIRFGREQNWWKDIKHAIYSNPCDNLGAFILVTLCIVLVSYYIYRFNYKWCLEKADFDDIQRKKVALSLAVFTAPYWFYLPTEWFY